MWLFKPLILAAYFAATVRCDSALPAKETAVDGGDDGHGRHRPHPTRTRSSGGGHHTIPPVISPPTTIRTSTRWTRTTYTTTTTTLPYVTPTTRPPWVSPTYPVPTNTWAAKCPVPYSITITNFKSSTNSLNETDGTAKVSLSISYNDTTLICPTKKRTGLPPSGYAYDPLIMDCDGAQLTEVDTDGYSWLYVFEQFWCMDVPTMTFANGTVGNPNSFGVDAQLANLTPYLDCTIDESSIRTCVQNTPKIVLQIQTLWELPFYTDPGVTPSDPISLDGTYLGHCPTVYGHPFITNPYTCDGRNVK
ncbi:hypothetical protein BGZ60DRAFT_426794 [Tricladium varicosporioides]|nr:hypothetical protein BGZ60DRAFT_426794 [Hymenoscyphus varicosporioides]